MNTYKLIVYVPVSHVEAVKLAIFAAGAGKQGHYEQCCWQTLGQGQFRPLAGSDPFIGAESKASGAVERVDEYRIEVLCGEDCLDGVIQALKVAHPYEEPAYDIILRHPA
jgi:hypothetical protein